MTYTFYITGMHCTSCARYIEETISSLENVSSVKVSHLSQQIEVQGDFGDATIEEISHNLTEAIQSRGYAITLKKQVSPVTWSEFAFAVPLAIGFIVFFVLLQKLGIVNLVTATEVSYGTAFVIGLIASVSSCMAVVGGLVLSMSANFAMEGNKVRPQILFHVGRLVSFFVLGGIVGALGSFFQIGATGTFALNFIVAVVLLILGINLLKIFPWMHKLQPTLPAVIGNHVQQLKTINHTLTPILVGIATFFLPCGFTQSMQIYSLGTGSFISGAMTMFMFALGTLPVLALLSFSSLAIHSKVQSGIFFKTVGLIVIFFGLLNLYYALVVAGFIPPILTI